jgi:hypothetical protein
MSTEFEHFLATSSIPNIFLATTMSHRSKNICWLHKGTNHFINTYRRVKAADSIPTYRMAETNPHTSPDYGAFATATFFLKFNRAQTAPTLKLAIS